MVGKAADKSNYGEKAASVSTDVDLMTRFPPPRAF
jgi:hypothetical protein